MKKNKLFFAVVSVLSLALLIPALLIPSIAVETSNASTVLCKYTFDDVAEGADLKTALGGTMVYPSTAAIVTNPDGSGDKVLKIDSAAVATGDAKSDFIGVSTYVYWITWNDDAKTAGTATRNGTTTTLDVTSTDGGKTVLASNGNTYTVYNDAATAELCGGGNNVDKNVTVGTSEMSYTSYKKVILQAEYYIPANATGTFESQFHSYSTNGTAKTWLNLFTINLDTGILKTGYVLNKNNTQEAISLEKEVWNTVSILIDLESGKATFYINGTETFAGQITAGGTALTNLTLTKGWILAKLNKMSVATVADFAGGIYINNALCETVQDSTVVTDVLFTEATLLSGRKVVTSGNFLNNHGVTASFKYVSDYENMIAPVAGASIRLSNTSGIRFATKVNTKLLDELVAAKKAGALKNVQIGTLITPYDYVVEAGGFTVDALNKLNYSAKYLDVQADIGSYYNIGETPDTANGYNTWFVGSIVDIRPDNRTREFTGMGYVRITCNDGSVKYIYSYDYADAATQKTNYARSISYIADYFKNDERFADYKDLLTSLSSELPSLTLSSTTLIKNVKYSINEFFFQNAAGVAFQLMYDGNNGWRLQAVATSDTGTAAYNHFDNVGAAQALSMYLGDGYNDESAKLTITSTDSLITIRAEGTNTYVTLNVTGSFNLQFFSANGVLMNNVTSVTADGSTVTMMGDLLANEAIYGGGERFDAANKRGKFMTLYTYDAYNAGVPGTTNEVGTYTVIPLFTSSRGSGMFINRYEYMTADWGNTSKGNTSANVWEISIDHSLIDCYFYATGNMADAIYGYTDLAGHATLPEEWAQGVLICRYSPDFQSLNGEQMYFDNLEDISGYEKLTVSGGALATTVTEWTSGMLLYKNSSARYRYVDEDGDGVGQFIRCTAKGGAPMGAGVKAIVENLIAAGMKPTAMVLEGLNYTNISSKANYQNLVDIIEWLEAQDIKVTVYMGVGAISSGMPGYKEEYAVHATVTNTITIENGKTETSTSGTVFTTTTTETWTHSYTAETATTIKIPKSAYSSNPDALGGGTQTYLDITNPVAVEWYINTVWAPLIELGLDGCKIDFCETMPNDNTVVSLLGTKTTVTKKWTGTSETTKETVEIGTTTIEYHWYDDTVFDGGDVHHAYSTYFISLFCKEMLEIAPDGFVVLNRGGGIGMQRNPYMWAGDQTREEITLTTQLLAVLNSGISGIPFMTYDMAGYGYGSFNYWNKTYDEEGAATAKALESEIYVRAIQYSAFSLMIQTHGDVRHMYELSDEAQRISALYTKLHDELMDYIQSYSDVACKTGMPVLRLLVLQYQNDTNVYDIDDQYMFGDALMVAPILTLDTTSREVYLPEGNWIDLLTGTEYEVGAGGKTITVTAELDQIPVFLNKDASAAEDLADTVFNGVTWQTINGGHEIPFGADESDPKKDDIFFDPKA